MYSNLQSEYFEKLNEYEKEIIDANNLHEFKSDSLTVSINEVENFEYEIQLENFLYTSNDCNVGILLGDNKDYKDYTNETYDIFCDRASDLCSEIVFWTNENKPFIKMLSNDFKIPIQNVSKIAEITEGCYHFENCSEEEQKEIIALANNVELEEFSLHGYSQGDWINLYVFKSKDNDFTFDKHYLECVFFGGLYEIYTLDENDIVPDCIAYIADNEKWELEEDYTKLEKYIPNIKDYFWKGYGVPAFKKPDYMLEKNTINDKLNKANDKVKEQEVKTKNNKDLER